MRADEEGEEVSPVPLGKVTIENCIDALLVAGLADWVDESGVAWVAQSVGGAPAGADARRLAVQLVSEVLHRGLMEIGDLSAPSGGFLRWDIRPEAAVELLERTWVEAGDDCPIGDFFWLQITPAGRARGGAVPEDAFPEE